jgi:hypothetical protein
VRTTVADGWAVLEVANTGDDLRGVEVAELLQPFRRAHRQRVGSGYGLGLSIVAAITHAHDGQVTLHALPTGGLHVQVSLPARLAPPSVAHDNTGAVRQAATKAPPVLAVVPPLLVVGTGVRVVRLRAGGAGDCGGEAGEEAQAFLGVAAGGGVVGDEGLHVGAGDDQFLVAQF